MGIFVIQSKYLRYFIMVFYCARSNTLRCTASKLIRKRSKFSVIDFSIQNLFLSIFFFVGKIYLMQFIIKENDISVTYIKKFLTIFLKFGTFANKKMKNRNSFPQVLSLIETKMLL